MKIALKTGEKAVLELKLQKFSRERKKNGNCIKNEGEGL